MANNRTVASRVLPSLPEQEQTAPRRSKRNNAGQGGPQQQLEKVANAIDQQAPRKRSMVPDNVPFNPMAPTPRCTKTQKPSQKPRKVWLRTDSLQEC